MEELGGALVVEPYLETIVMAAGLLRCLGGPISNALLRRIVNGEIIMAVAWAEPTSRYRFRDVATTARQEAGEWKLSGTKSVVTAAPLAAKLIVTARTAGETADAHGISLFLVDRDNPGLRLHEYPTIDGRQAADVILDEVTLPPEALLGEEGMALGLLERMGDEAIAAICAEALGIMRRLLRDTIDYTTQRRQFGQPIANFQVLQHRMVDMYMQTEMAISATYLATLTLDADPIERAKAASAAKVTVSNACHFVGQNAIQLHGAMGMTDELPVGHYFKRASVIEGELGTADYHLARFAELNRAGRDRSAH
jgi:alkylation response protein AidB-like acyl-CoA dehydrogenase